MLCLRKLCHTSENGFRDFGLSSWGNLGLVSFGSLNGQARTCTSGSFTAALGLWVFLTILGEVVE